jgi:hypothetical protein
MLSVDSGFRDTNSVAFYVLFIACSCFLCLCFVVPISHLLFENELLIAPKDGKLTCGFFGKIVALSGSRLPIDTSSDTLPSLLDLGEPMPKRLPASTIQLPFPVPEPADAGVVGQDWG